MDDKNNKDKANKFTSAMGDLKGLLDKEGIKVNSPQDSNPESPETPALDTSDIDIQDITDTIGNELITNFEQNLRNQQLDGFGQDEKISSVNDDSASTKLPTLDGTISIVDEKVATSSDLDSYISDMEDDQFDVLEFGSSIEDLEQKVESITEPEHLEEFVQREGNNEPYKMLKKNLQAKLAQQIETSLDELKVKLIASMNSEINKLFK